MSYGNNGVVPQINYGAGFGTAFNPTYAATNKIPGVVAGMSAIRHDSITTSGLQQSVLERIDRVFDLNFPVVPLDDIADWDTFLAYALGGGQFQYVPDLTDPTSYLTCYLMGLDVPYKRVGFELYSISLKCRVVQTAEIGS